MFGISSGSSIRALPLSPSKEEEAEQRLISLT